MLREQVDASALPIQLVPSLDTLNVFDSVDFSLMNVSFIACVLLLIWNVSCAKIFPWLFEEEVSRRWIPW